MYRYIGSGPYCYSNSLAMILGGPGPAVIEVLTGSPFGFELLAGRLPLFDPYGWNPDLGLDAAIDLLGWACRRDGAEDGPEAIGKLRAALVHGPALVGPVEIGLLVNHPEFNQPIGSDHFVVALAVDDERVTYHDPHGLPFATLPVPEFLAAWRADTSAYKSTRYTLRSQFRRVRPVSEEEALLACLPRAAAWLAQRDDVEVPPGTIGGGRGIDRLADMVLAGLDPGTHGHLVHFAIRVGARRLADAATALAGLGRTDAAEVAGEQARLVGSLQYELVAGSIERAAETLRTLGPTYERLAGLLKEG